jgi:hypothetical protein
VQWQKNGKAQEIPVRRMHRRTMTNKRKPKVKVKIDKSVEKENVVEAPVEPEVLVEAEPEVQHENSFVKWLKSLW